jgi:hypothetical protein
MTPRPVRSASLGLVLVSIATGATLSGCGLTQIGATASPAVPGIDWRRSAEIVERPEEAFASLDPTTLVPLGTGRSGHPSHFPGQAVMADVAWTGTVYVSVGYVFPDWHPIAWTSPDGDVWSLHSVGGGDFTFPVSVVVAPDGSLVAVGRSGKLPIAWTSSDGVAWSSHPVPTLGQAGVAERMTTVTAAPDGYLAGGSVGPETLDRHARFWRSSDGATWTPVGDDPSAFANAEVRSIVGLGSGFVAIGLLGTAVEPTGSVAWTSPDGEHWTRIESPDLQKGRAVALALAPDGGLVAVGTDQERHEATVWTSPDGRAWTLTPGEPSRRHTNGFIQMNDVSAFAGAFIAVGDDRDLQYPTLAAWRSTDGSHWARAPEIPVFQQSEAYGIAAGQVPRSTGGSTPGIVVVGSFGNPDDSIPTVWLSPPG